VAKEGRVKIVGQNVIMQERLTLVVVVAAGGI
jgi:hypothetical protein